MSVARSGSIVSSAQLSRQNPEAPDDLGVGVPMHMLSQVLSPATLAERACAPLQAHMLTSLLRTAEQQLLQRFRFGEHARCGHLFTEDDTSQELMMRDACRQLAEQVRQDPSANAQQWTNKQWPRAAPNSFEGHLSFQRQTSISNSPLTHQLSLTVPAPAPNDGFLAEMAPASAPADIALSGPLGEVRSHHQAAIKRIAPYPRDASESDETDETVESPAGYDAHAATQRQEKTNAATSLHYQSWAFPAQAYGSAYAREPRVELMGKRDYINATLMHHQHANSSGHANAPRPQTAGAPTTMPLQNQPHTCTAPDLGYRHIPHRCVTENPDQSRHPYEMQALPAGGAVPDPKHLAHHPHHQPHKPMSLSREAGEPTPPPQKQEENVRHAQPKVGEHDHQLATSIVDQRLMMLRQGQGPSYPPKSAALAQMAHDAALAAAAASAASAVNGRRCSSRPLSGSHVAAAAAAAAASRLIHAEAEASGSARGSARSSSINRRAWSASEDQTIRECVAQMGMRWRLIAPLLPGRSDDSVRNRWKRLKEEDENGVGDATHEGGEGSSRSEGAKKLKVSHDSKRASKPASHPHGKGDREGDEEQGQRVSWSSYEDQVIVRAVRELGPRWCAVAARLPSRTDQAVRNRWNRLQQRARVQARTMLPPYAEREGLMSANSSMPRISSCG
ncbi:MAG: hypothetical protein SGPRY_001366 [Prymnesium sp.]